MTDGEKKAWEVLGPDTFIHSCNCPVCHSLRDDSGRSCLGCRDHHVQAIAAAAELSAIRERMDVEQVMEVLCEVDGGMWQPSWIAQRGKYVGYARAVIAYLGGE